MASLRPGYRLKLYRPRSTGETELLTPPAGAPHALPFAVATLHGVTEAIGETIVAYQPYLDPPKGKRGSLSWREKKVDAGDIKLPLLDKKLDVANDAQRFVSAFVGDESGELGWHALLAVIDRTLDGGASWERWWTGRVRASRTDGSPVLELTVRDMSEDLDTDVFVGLPHHSITYATQQTLTPTGLTARYGNIDTVPWLRGVMRNGHFTNDDRRARRATLFKPAHELADEAHQSGSFVSEQFLFMEFTPGKAWLLAREVGASTVYRFRLTRLSAEFNGTNTDKLWRVYGANVEALDPAEYGYREQWPNGVAVDWCVVPAGGPTPDAPILIDDVHPVQLWKDLLDGKFGYFAPDGSPLRTIAYDAGAFAALIADDTFPRLRLRIEEPSALVDWLEDHLFQTCGLSYRLDAQGRVVPLDLRIQNAMAASVTITDELLLEEEGAFAWETTVKEATRRIECAYALDIQVDRELEKLGARGAIPDLPLTLLEKAEVPYFVVDGSSRALDHGDRAFKVKTPGLRATANLLKRTDGKARVEGHLLQLARELQTPYRRGETAFSTRHPIAAVLGIETGTFARAQLLQQPNPAEWARGGERVAICTGVSEDDDVVELSWLDLGPALTAAPPTLTDLALGATEGTATVTLTLNADADPALVQLAAVPLPTALATGANVPSHYWRSVGFVAAGGVSLILTVPRNARIFVRARSMPDADSPSTLPSPWAYASAPAYVDTAGLTAPSGLAAAPVGKTTAHLAWMNGEADLPLELLLVEGAAPADWNTVTPLTTLPAGSVQHDLSGLAPATTYHVAVRHTDGAGGVSAVSATSFTTTAIAPVLPRPAGLDVDRRADGTGTPTTPADAIGQAAVGVLVSLFPSAAYGFAVRRAADDGAGNPDLSTIEVLDATIPVGATLYLDPLPDDGVVRHYSIAHAQDGDAGTEWTCWRAAKPAVIPATASAAVPVAPRWQAAQSDDGATGTLTLTKIDPQCRVTKVEAKSRSGAGAETPYAALVPVGDVYTAQVTLDERLTSTITIRVTAYDETGVLREVEAVYTFRATSGGAPTGPSFLTALDERAALPSSFRLVDGDGTEVEYDVGAGTVQVNVIGGGTIAIYHNGVLIDPAATAIDFTGESIASVTSDGAGFVTVLSVECDGGGGGPGGGTTDPPTEDLVEAIELDLGDDADSIVGMWDARYNRRANAAGEIWALDDVRCQRSTGALYLHPGGDGHVTVPDYGQHLSGLGALTLMWWGVTPVQANGASATAVFLEGCYDTATGGGFLLQKASGQWYFWIRTGAASEVHGRIATTPWEDGDLIGLAWTFDGGGANNAARLKAYWCRWDQLAGAWTAWTQLTLSFTGTIPATLGAIDAGFDLTIGARVNGTNPYRGVCHEVRLKEGAALTLGQLALETPESTSQTWSLRYSFDGGVTNSGSRGASFDGAASTGHVFVSDEPALMHPILFPEAKALTAGPPDYIVLGSTANTVTCAQFGSRSGLDHPQDVSVGAIGYAPHVTNGTREIMAASTAVFNGVSPLQLRQQNVGGLAGDQYWDAVADAVAVPADTATEAQRAAPVALLARKWNDAGTFRLGVRVRDAAEVAVDASAMTGGGVQILHFDADDNWGTTTSWRFFHAMLLKGALTSGIQAAYHAFATATHGAS